MQVRGVDENYKQESDKAFESLWAWYWQRQTVSIDPLDIIIDCLEDVGINPKHIDDIKV